MNRLIVKYKDNFYRVDMSEENTRIYSSYKMVCHTDMIEFLGILEEKYPELDLAIRKRSKFGMLVEWKAHNLLYYLRLFRSHTADVDLNVGQKWYVMATYFVLSLMYWK